LGPVTASYDVDNRLASISTPNGAEVYAYSAANQRLRKAGRLYFYGVGGELLVNYDYVYGSSGVTPWNPRTQVYFGGMLVFGEGDRRLTMDRLGSTVRTEGYFQPEYRYRYYPYGEQQGGSSNEDQVKFGTYWRDTVSGLDYAQNRYFAATQGRFTSADPYVMSGGMGDSQGWNRYTYVGNDPVNFNDPRGLMQQAPTYSITVTAMGLGDLEFWWAMTLRNWYAEPGGGGADPGGNGGNSNKLGSYEALVKAEKLLVTAGDMALKALTIPDCAKLFVPAGYTLKDPVTGGTLDPATVLNQLLKATATLADRGWGTIGFSANMNDNTMATTAGFGYTFSLGGGYYRSVKVKMNMVYWNMGYLQANVTVLLHELGHVMNKLAEGILSINSFADDSGSDDKSTANTRLVEDNCIRKMTF
jgi:RHS repeat-associated protein